jgi:hypothetical protein
VSIKSYYRCLTLNKKMKKKILIFIGVISLGINSTAMAQFGPDTPPPGSQDGPDSPPPGYEEGPDAPPEGPPASPINDYIPLLIIAGAAFGFRKLNNKTKSINLE